VFNMCTRLSIVGDWLFRLLPSLVPGTFPVNASPCHRRPYYSLFRARRRTKDLPTCIYCTLL